MPALSAAKGTRIAPWSVGLRAPVLAGTPKGSGADQLDERDREDRSVNVHSSSLKGPARGEVNDLGAIHLIPLIQLVISLTS